MTHDFNLDQRMAEEVMEWKSSEPFGIEWMGEGLDPIRGIEKEDWSPTRKIEQALGDGGPGTVVGKMLQKGWRYTMWDEGEDGEKVGFEFYQGRVTEFKCLDSPDAKYGRAFADTPAKAICLAVAAALPAMEIK